jgi:hypothetical protein
MWQRIGLTPEYTTVDKAKQYNSRYKEKWQKYNKVLSFLRIGRSRPQPRGNAAEDGSIPLNTAIG